MYTDIPIHRVKIEYNDGVTQETAAINNTFIIEMPASFNDQDSILFMGELLDVKAMDEDNNEVVNWSK
ncbi:hypothetical protein D3C77_487490 [compost metagenome]